MPSAADPASPGLVLLDRGPGWAAFDKPSGLAVHRGWADDGGPYAVDLARAQLGADVSPVHRLDRGTSGVLLFAETASDAAALQRAFGDGRVEKFYLALVRGRPPAAGTIDHPVPRSKELAGPEHRVAAVTDFRTLATTEVAALGRTFSLVVCRPRTGRQHQIRRHFKHIAHPLIGDAYYGKGDLNRHFRATFGLARLALHAAALSFPPPRGAAGADPVTLRAALPPDLEGPLARLGLTEAVPADASAGLWPARRHIHADLERDPEPDPGETPCPHAAPSA
jgi:tRNA pseudouridine65 synthase